MLYKIQLKKPPVFKEYKGELQKYSRCQLCYSAVFLGGASPEAVRTKEIIKREFLQNCYWLSLFLGDEFREKREESPKGNAGLLESGTCWDTAIQTPRKTVCVRAGDPG